MSTNISLKNRIIMAYKGKSPYMLEDESYYKYSSEWTFIFLMFSGWIFEVIIIFVGIIFFFTLTTNLLLNLFIAILVFPYIISKFIQFLAFLLLPIQKITKEEYEEEIKKLEEDKSEEKKKSFFQKYKDYKKYKIKKGYD